MEGVTESDAKVMREVEEPRVDSRLLPHVSGRTVVPLTLITKEQEQEEIMIQFGPYYISGICERSRWKCG